MKRIDLAGPGRAYAVLREYGLLPFKAPKGVKAFRGKLQCANAEVLVSFEITDWEFTKYPRLTLLDRSAPLPPLLAHVDGPGDLCYISPGSLILDRYRPEVAVQQCLDAAIRVLNDVISGKSQVDEIANEFTAYWTVGQLPAAWPVLIDLPSEDCEGAQYFFLREEGKLARGLIAQNTLDARKLVASIDIEELSKGSLACLLFHSKTMPAIGTGGLPATVHDFFQWVRQWDPLLSKQLQQRLGSDKDYLKRSGCVIAISTPAGGLGVLFSHDRKHRLGYARSPKLYRQFLHAAGGSTPITRLRLDDISASYVHTRNLDEYPSLISRRISLIGCGAIGGYLASALVRLGAGTGTNGLLRLFDVGELEPDNLGRHTLGFPALYQNKAEALRNELVRQFPYAEIEASTNTPTLTDEFFTTDLVIDCTGDEAVSEMINARHVRSRRGPVLYVWIRGNGECVQALWVDAHDKHGCYRCMRNGVGANYRKERFPVLDGAAKTRFLGCRSFTPYSVSSPLAVTALATDMVIDWLKGNVAPRFRTRYIENTNARRVKNQDLSLATGCPACQPT